MKRAVCLAFGLAVLFAGVGYGQLAVAADAPAAAKEGGWVNISDKVIKALADDGKKTPGPVRPPASPSTARRATSS